MAPESALAILSFPLALVTLLFCLYEIKKNQIKLSQQKKQIDQRIYETLILREVGERIGYELNIERILETITSTLNKLLPYSVVSYLLVTPDPNKILLRIHLDEPVSRQFIDEMIGPILTTFNDLVKTNYTQTNLDEQLSGTIIDESDNSRVMSFWLTPIIINSRGRGVLAIGSKKPGLYHGEETKVLEKIMAQANRAVNSLEKVLEEEKGKISAAVESLADGVIMLDTEENLVAINPMAKKILRIENPSPTILDVAMALSDKMDIRAKIETAAAQNQTVGIDNLNINGTDYQVLVSPVKSHGGVTIGGAILFHDISAQKELERLRQDFTAMMVHELRAPLTVVRGTTDMLKENPSLLSQPAGAELLKNMASSAESMLNLVNDLLDVAKIDSGKFSITKLKDDLVKIASERVEAYKPLAIQKSIELELISQNSSESFEFDRNRVSQVFNNLLSNALKFTPSGGRITVSIRQEEGTVVCCVQDTGEGIPKEKIGELFSKFKQIKPSDKGTGLGLAIAKGIV